jgi:hypothetical protein
VCVCVCVCVCVSDVRLAFPNIALNRLASFSVVAIDGGSAAGKCVDGIVTTPEDGTNKCHSSGFNDYLQIDLGQTHQLQWFKLHNRRCPNQIQYECLDRINGFTLWSSASPISIAQHDALKAGQTPADLTLLHTDITGGHQNDATPYIIQGTFAAGASGRYVILHVRTNYIHLREIEIGEVAVALVPLMVHLSGLGDTEFPSGGFAGAIGRRLEGIQLRPIVGPRVLIEIMASVVGLGDTPWRSHGQKHQTDSLSRSRSRGNSVTQRSAAQRRPAAAPAPTAHLIACGALPCWPPIVQPVSPA